MDSNDITRRRVISTLGAAGAVGLAGCGGGGGGGGTTTPGNVDSVRIGMVQPLSGALKAYGKIAMQGFYSYFGYENGASAIPKEIKEEEVSFDVDGTTYTIDVRDSAANRSEAKNLASQMADEGATILAGATSSASAIAIAQNVAKRRGIPYMAGPAASVALTGDKSNCSRAVFRASENVAMDAQSGGKYVADNTDINSVYIYYADYSFGKSVKNNYQRVLEANGVTVKGTQALPQGYSSDWPAQFSKAVNADVDAIIGGFTVATLPAMLGSYLAGNYEFRVVGGWGTRFSGAALGAVLKGALDEVTRESIDQAGLGPFTTRYHWNQYDNEINSKLIDVHRKAYGLNPDLFTSGMFTAASSIVQAVQEAGSAEPADIVDQLRGMSVKTTPKGKGGYKFQKFNNQAKSAMTVADPIPTPKSQQKYWPGAIMPSKPVEGGFYGMDKTTKSADLVGCSLGN